MQIGALNSFNQTTFTGKNTNRQQKTEQEKSSFEPDSIYDKEGRIITSSDSVAETSLALSTEEKMETYNKALEKSQQNVHNTTIIAGALALAAAYKAGKGIAQVSAKTVLKTGELLARGVVDVVGTVSSKLGKKLNVPQVNAEKGKQAIVNFANGIRQNAERTGKAPGIVKEFTDEVLPNKGTAKLIQGFANENLKNGYKVAEAAAGTVVGLKASDWFSDQVEKGADEAELRQVAEALFGTVA